MSRLAPLCSALAFTAAACSESSTPAAATAAPDAGAIVAVAANGLPRFVTPGAAAGTESVVTINAGATVSWRFMATGYNVISGSGPDGGCVADGVFCSPDDQGCTGSVPPQVAGSYYQRTFPDAGDYPYFSQPGCPQGMAGVVHVQEGPPDGGVDGGVDGGTDGGP